MYPLNPRPINPDTTNKAPATIIQCGYSISESHVIFREMAASGKDPSEIARLLHRSPSAIRKRASLLGITVQLVDAKGK